MINIINGDCMGLMKDKPDNYYDLAIVDPEYGINAGKMTMGKGSYNDNGKHKKKDWDNKVPDKQYFDELFRVSKNQIIWGGNYFNLPPSRCFLIWDKMDYNSDFASAELAWASFDKVIKTFRFSRAANTNNAVVPDMFKSFKRIHPTQKPVALYKWLLKNYAKEGDKILDSHGGSLSHALAVHDMNHAPEPMNLSLDIIELDKDYYEAGLKRYNKHIQQLTIF